MRGTKCKNYRKTGYNSKKKRNRKAVNYEKNLYQAQKLYYPNYNYNNNKNNNYNFNKNNRNNYTPNSLLYDYMNEYEMLYGEDKIPFTSQNNFSYQEYEFKKNKIQELFENFMENKEEDENNEINKIIVKKIIINIMRWRGC